MGGWMSVNLLLGLSAFQRLLVLGAQNWLKYERQDRVLRDSQNPIYSNALFALPRIRCRIFPGEP
jgi:hypothetical protein